MSARSGGAGPAPAAAAGWRTLDIVVAAVIGVAFGVVFWFWGAFLWGLFTALGPFQNLFYAVWLIPAVLAPLIVRKPGAAIFAELLAAAVSALIGSQWGVDVLLSGLLQGLGAEVVFAAFRYRHWSFPVLGLAAVGSAAAAWLHDWVVWYAAVAVETQLLVGACMAVSAVVIVGAGSVALARALREAGVLEGFPR